MDPDRNLREQLQLAEIVLDDRSDDSMVMAAAVGLADLVQSLDAWLGRGGFLPRRWER